MFEKEVTPHKNIWIWKRLQALWGSRKHTSFLQQGLFFFHYSPANLMNNWAKIFTGLLFCAYVGIHQVRILVLDYYQRCPVPWINCNKLICKRTSFIYGFLEVAGREKGLTFVLKKNACSVRPPPQPPPLKWTQAVDEAVMDEMEDRSAMGSLTSCVKVAWSNAYWRLSCCNQ